MWHKLVTTLDPKQSKSAVLLFQICTALATDAQITDVKLSSTEHSVTLTFSPNIAATNYTASFRLSQGIFWKDYGLEGPYSGSPLQVTHTSLLPGSRYTVEVFENLTRVSHKVYQEEIATGKYSYKENTALTLYRQTICIDMCTQSRSSLSKGIHVSLKMKEQIG